LTDETVSFYFDSKGERGLRRCHSN
jgi:hypothetical protein